MALVDRADDGYDVPVVDDAPAVPSHLLWAWVQFRHMDSTCRPHIGGGMGPSIAGPIPHTTMLAILDRHPDIGEAGREWYLAIWQRMDAAAMEIAHQRMKDSQNVTKNPIGGTIHHRRAARVGR